MSQPAEESALAKLLQEISGNVTRRAHPRDVKASPIAAARLREAYSKIRLRLKSEAPFAPFATERSSAPLSSSRTQPPLRATIDPMRPRPATVSPGAAVRIAPSIFRP